MNLARVAGRKVTWTKTRSVGYPPDTERVQADMVAGAERVGIQDSLICIPAEFVVGDTPGFVTNSAFAVLTGAIGAVSTAMETKRGWRRVHEIAPGKPRMVSARRLV